MRKTKKVMCTMLVFGILVTSNIIPVSAATTKKISAGVGEFKSQNYVVNNKTDTAYGSVRVVKKSISNDGYWRASAANDAKDAVDVSFGRNSSYTNVMPKTKIGSSKKADITSIFVSVKNACLQFNW